MRRGWWIGLMVAGAVVLWWVQQSEPEPQLTEIEQAEPIPEPEALEPPLASAVQDAEAAWRPPVLYADSYESEWGVLPASLRGTQIPFFMSVDAQGQLVPSFAVRQLFDYFFTTEGEEPRETILARIRELLERYLPSDAAAQAQNVLLQYLALKDAELAMQERLAADYQASGRPLDLVERARLLRELRASNLDLGWYEAFFGEEELRQDYALRRLEVMRDDSLDADQKSAALQELEAHLPPAARVQREQARLEMQVTEQVQQARSQGASEAQIRQIREQAWGAEAAERFAQADRRQQQWEHRVAAYRSERAAILGSSALTPDDQAAQIARLREQHFDEHERVRIEVIDRMRDEQSSTAAGR
jgi:lipase chaperone LimK